MSITGAQIALECLMREGVEVIFGYPGGANIPIYDALYNSRIRHILTRHEQGAVLRPKAYARASGQPGVCLATSGPGATNLVTGIADAKMDGVPLVCITGQVRRPMIGTDAFQETDVVGLTLAITKFNCLVTRTEELPRLMAQAFHVARSGRPGPVLIDIPVDVSKERLETVEFPETGELPGYTPEKKARLPFEQVIDLLASSRRPVAIVGAGAKWGGATAQVPGTAGPTEAAHRIHGPRSGNGSRRPRLLPGNGGNARHAAVQHCRQPLGSAAGAGRSPR